MTGEHPPSTCRNIRFRVTAGEVARKAGVSAATVSIVFSGRRENHVSAETRERVRRIADEMGYVPSRLGKGFLQGRSRIVGVVMRFNPVVPWIEGVLAIQDELTRAGYVPITLSPTVLVEPEPTPGKAGRPSELFSEIGCIRRLLEYQIDGLIYFAISPEQAAEIMPEVKRHQVPTVLVANSPKSVEADFVAADERKIGRMAARHLLSLEAKTFWAVENESDFVGAATRREAFVAELKKAGKPCGHITLSGDHRECLERQWPDRFRTPAGVFAFNDLDAAITVNVARARGCRVPEDVAVLGMGGREFARHNSPPLATVSRNSAQVGRKAVELLLERLDGYDGPPRRSLIAPCLELRASALPMIPAAKHRSAGPPKTRS